MAIWYKRCSQCAFIQLGNERLIQFPGCTAVFLCVQVEEEEGIEVIMMLSFNYTIVNIGNSLPNAVVDVDSVDLFKSDLTIF